MLGCGRERVADSNCGNAGQAAQCCFSLSKELHLLLAGVVALPAQGNVGGQDGAGADSKILAVQVPEAAHQQRRGREQNHADGDLRDHH